MAEKEYIEREAMVKASCERCNGEYVPCDKEHCLLMEVIHSIPAADVRPVVRGKWIWDDEGYHCSECFYHAYGETGEVLSGHWHFFPNCGADMREES